MNSRAVTCQTEPRSASFFLHLPRKTQSGQLEHPLPAIARQKESRFPESLDCTSHTRNPCLNLHSSQFLTSCYQKQSETSFHWDSPPRCVDYWQQTHLCNKENSANILFETSMWREELVWCLFRKMERVKSPYYVFPFADSFWRRHNNDPLSNKQSAANHSAHSYHAILTSIPSHPLPWEKTQCPSISMIHNCVWILRRIPPCLRVIPVIIVKLE